MNIEHTVSKRELAKPFCLSVLTLGLVMVLGLGNVYAQVSESEYEYSGWSAGIGTGMMFYEMDEEVNSGIMIDGKVGYDIDPHWSIEGSLSYLPYLDNKHYNPPADSGLNDRFQLSDSTFGIRGAVDALYHFNTPNDRQWDPFLALTGGVTYYDANLENSQHFDPFGGLGGGLSYALDRNWYARGDYRVLVAGHDTEINHLVLASVGYRWGHERGTGSGDGRLVEPRADGNAPFTIHFAFDSAELSGEAKSKLNQNADWLKANPNETVYLTGNADERGTEEYNVALGERRARAAYNYLRALGISANRMNPISYGESRPVDSRSNEEAWAKNRRVETVPSR